jgi:hypothetical protein
MTSLGDGGSKLMEHAGLTLFRCSWQSFFGDAVCREQVIDFDERLLRILAT